MATPAVALVPEQKHPSFDTIMQTQRGQVNTIRPRTRLPWLNGTDGNVPSRQMPGTFESEGSASVERRSEARNSASTIDPPNQTTTLPVPRKSSRSPIIRDTLPHQTFFASGSSSPTRSSEGSTRISISARPTVKSDQAGVPSQPLSQTLDEGSVGSNISDPFKDQPEDRMRNETNTSNEAFSKPDPTLRPYSSTQSISRVSNKPRGHQRSLSTMSQMNRPQTMNGIIITQKSFSQKSAKGQYTPSSYDSTPPSERDMPATLPRKDLASYEDLVRKSMLNTTTPTTPQTVQSLAAMTVPRYTLSNTAKPPTWPMVLLSELEVEVPARTSSLTFAQRQQPPKPPSSLGRYIDGTISRKPTARRSIVRRSPDVSPRTLSPSSSPSSDKEKQTLERAVTGLQDLMQEALNVAKEAAQNNRSGDVAQILDEATLALRRAHTVQGQMSSPLQTQSLQMQPLQISESEESEYVETDSEGDGSSSDADIESNVSSIPPWPNISSDTFTTAYTKSRSGLTIKAAPMNRSSRQSMPVAESVPSQPVIMPPFTIQGRRPTSEKAAVLPSSSESQSMAQTPPRMYQRPPGNSIAADWAYPKPISGRLDLRGTSESGPLKEGEVVLPPPTGERSSVVLPALSMAGDAGVKTPEQNIVTRPTRISVPDLPRKRSLRPSLSESNLPPAPTQTPQPASQMPIHPLAYSNVPPKRFKPKVGASRIFESPYYHVPERQAPGNVAVPPISGVQAPAQPPQPSAASPDLSLLHPRKHHISLKDNQNYGLHRYRRQPIAREWNTLRKRITAAIACLNTALVGLIAGIYAGEVPRIQYQMGDEHHRVILGNVCLYLGMGITTLIAWPLPLLHGRKPYILAALALAIPLQFPQAIVVAMPARDNETRNMVGLLLPRVFLGLCLGFAHINFLTTLFDLFGASLQSRNPHQEIVVYDDVRRQGGGMGLWLGLWSFCFVGSLSVGFLIGAGIIQHLNPSWGFYVIVILLAATILMNVVAPETRRAPYRRSVLRYMDKDEQMKKRVARGEVKLHLSADGPKYWWEEVWAGQKLMGHMLLQPGFFVLAMYLAWIYALVVLVTLLLGALLSRNYRWHPQFIGLAVFAVAVGALLAVPLTKANIFSRDRVQPARTDSMTFQPRVTWSSHLVRRCLFTFALPIAGLAYVLASPGRSVSAAGPIVLSCIVGFLSCLAVAECIGLAMEAFDTSDLQPGINTKHRLQSMASATRRRRTNYSSYPRVCAGLFAAQGVGFLLAAAATGASGAITRALGAQAATGVVVGILLFLTILLSIIMWRFRSVQVIPNHALGSRGASRDANAPPEEEDREWKPVVIGNPSGKIRRMNVLEMGSWSRWTEIRRLNKLVQDKHFVG